MPSAKPQSADRKPDSTGRYAITLRLPGDLYDRLYASAAGYGLSVTSFTNKLLDEALADLIPPEEFRLTRPPKGAS